MENPTSLLEAVRQFAAPQVAHDFFLALRFPNGIACPRLGCGSADVAKIKNRNVWRCRECNRQFTVKVGTIFEDSPITFSKWLPAMWLLSANKNGISSCELARALKVTQKSAWFMLHRLRYAMTTDSFERLNGEVEIDETFVGGKEKYKKNYRARTADGMKRRSKGPMYGKTAILGMVQRGGGQVRAMKIDERTGSHLQRRIRRNVAPGTTVYTDAFGGYNLLDSEYVHRVIDHAVSYVEGNVTTNRIENFWSCLKRTLTGTYIAARPKHLDRYLDEQVFRFNERANTDGPRFIKALKGADSKRLTWNGLVGRIG
jgi:transposase-like protein